MSNIYNQHISEFGKAPTKKQWRTIRMYNRDLDKYLDPINILAQAIQKVTIWQRMKWWIKRLWRK